MQPWLSGIPWRDLFQITELTDQLPDAAYGSHPTMRLFPALRVRALVRCHQRPTKIIEINTMEGYGLS